MRILSIDLGQSSIGWLLRNTDEDGIEQFQKFGVLTFKKGVGEEKNVEYSLAAERTKYRSMRRLYQSRKYKLWGTLKKLKARDYCPIDEKALIEWTTYNKEKRLKRKYPIWDTHFENWIKLDFNEDGKPDFESPYQLRKYIAENELDLNDPKERYMFGRALYHIAQHRAFKSSKKVQLEEELKEETNVGAEKRKKEELKKEFEKNGLTLDEDKTIGQLLAEAEKFFKERGYGRIRNELHPYVTRKMLQQEVEKVFKFQFGDKWQQKFEEIFGVGKVSKCSIFWQRPLRSQKSSVGKCTLEKNKYRCPISHPQFERFRAWALINNIKYKIKNDEEFVSLSMEQKNKLYDEIFIKAGDFNFSTVRKWIMKEIQNENIILNYSDKTSIPGSPTIYYLTKILGENWESTQIKHNPVQRKRKSDNSQTYTSEKDYYTYEDIWHVAFQLDDEEEIEEIARNKFQFNDEQVGYYKQMFNKMEIGYAQLSLKAIKKINYFLRKGLIYTDAVLLAKIPDILGRDFYEEKEDFIIKSLKNIIESNRNKKTIISITNNLISEYKINHYHERDYAYIIKEDDIRKIEDACKSHFGNKSWENMDTDEKDNILEEVKKEFQAFFKDKNREYRKLPKIQDDLKTFLKNNFNFLSEKKLNMLYHPSAIDIYPKLTGKDKDPEDGKLYLKSPQTGSWKNPMAIRVLQELRQLINYLISTDQIDEQTKIVIEIPRELNDTNRRKAYEIWQKRKEEENKEFAIAIGELINNSPGMKANPNNDSDLDKFRLWYEQCFDSSTGEYTEKGPNELNQKKRKNKKGEAIEEDVFKENRFEKINAKTWFEIQKAKDNVLEKYRLWSEQKAVCIYTGKIIRLTDLFNENTIDIEHTLPYSRSLDNSLTNKTVCFKEYNRNVKKNLIPYECPDYEEIMERIKPWEDKVENIKKHLEFWKNESKKTNTKNRKDECVVQKHLWSWELKYWQDKVDKFKMKEITSGFVNAQLVETQLISKYAFHYLKTLFENVQVQKGEITAEFSKIIGLREKYKPKNRDKHSHHVIDAFILSLIPDSSRLKRILETNAEKQEIEKNIKDGVYNKNEIVTYMDKLNILDKELKQFLIEARIPVNYIHKITEKIENEVINISPVKHKIFAISKKKIKKGRLKGKYSTGDVVRGQLHKESFYGKIKLIKRDENGKPMRDPNTNEWIWETDKKGNTEYAFVKRVPVDENLDIDKIVDPEIKKIFKEKIEVEKQSLKEMKKQGGLFFTHPKTGKPIRIRHVRCYQKPTELLGIKKQTYPSRHEYKNFYYADNAENIYYALYEYKDDKDDKKIQRTFEMLNLFDAIKLKKSISIENIEDFFERTKEVGKGSKKSIAKLKAVLYPKQKVIFYKNSIEELKELTKNELSKRIYFIYALYGKTTGQIQFQHHLEARPDKDIKDPNNPSKKLIGFSSVDIDNLQPRYLLSPLSFNFAIEGKDFELKPDGEITWKF